MFVLIRQVLDTGLTKVHNTFRSLERSYSLSARYCILEAIYIQHVVC